MADEDIRSLRVPVWCPLCDGPMKGKSTSTWYDWGVCSLCFIEFVEGRESRWRSGWRPTPEQVAGASAPPGEDSTG